MDKLDSENLYRLLKKDIKKKKDISSIRKTTSSTSNYSFTQEEIFNSKKVISFGEDVQTKWGCLPFETKINDKKILSPKIAGQWGEFENIMRINPEIKGFIYRSSDDINYKIVNNTISGNFLLRGKSEFWMFLHVNEEFDDETVVIYFSKAKYSDNVSMSLGTFILKDDEDLKFQMKKKMYLLRILQTLQMVRSYEQKEKTNNNPESDSCLIKILIKDEGNEEIKVSAWINDGDTENQLIGRFFKQVEFNDNEAISSTISSSYTHSSKTYRVMIAGSGQYCRVKKLSCETNYKEKYEYMEGCKSKFEGCNVCSVI